MADTTFKKQPITFPQGWVRYSDGNEIGSDKYKPDLSFADKTGQVVCLIESSSTNDRKVGVGELCLADKFFSDNKTDGVLIFSLCGNSAYPPRPETQIEYIRPYFLHLKRTNLPHGVREIYFVFEKDFNALGWVALDDKFKAKAYALKA